MKNLFKKKNITFIAVATIFIIFIGYFTTGVQAGAIIPTDDKDILAKIKPIIHVGGGQQFIEGFFNIKGPHNGTTFDATSPENTSSVFEKAQDASSFFATIGNSWVGGRLFVGVPRSNDRYGFNFKNILFNDGDQIHNWLKNFGGSFAPNLSATLQKVNVQGEVLSTNLIHSSGSDNLCISPEGSLVVCSTSVYNWDIGTWSDCSGGTTTGGTCSGTWTTEGTGSCSDIVNGMKIDNNGNQYNWYDNEIISISHPNSYTTIYIRAKESSGNWQSTTCYNEGGSGSCDDPVNVSSLWEIIDCSTLGATNESSCKASPHETCRWGNGLSSTYYCSDKDGTSQSTCEGYNPVCSWSGGTGNTKTRTVVCKDSSNNIVADSFCSEPKPATEEAC